jgi:hypothetical protein
MFARSFATVAAVLLLAGPAVAQDSLQIDPRDPRLTAALVTMLQSELALRDAILAAMREDEAKRKTDLAEWFRGWFGQQQIGQAASPPSAKGD